VQAAETLRAGPLQEASKVGVADPESLTADAMILLGVDAGATERQIR